MNKQEKEVESNVLSNMSVTRAVSHREMSALNRSLDRNTVESTSLNVQVRVEYVNAVMLLMVTQTKKMKTNESEQKTQCTVHVHTYTLT